MNSRNLIAYQTIIDIQMGNGLWLQVKDGIIQIYTTEIEELLQIAKSQVTRQLTAEEKRSMGCWIGRNVR